MNSKELESLLMVAVTSRGLFIRQLAIDQFKITIMYHFIQEYIELSQITDNKSRDSPLLGRDSV